ncbi:Transcriptional regulatory protein ZraR [Polystyrenella longa]|uniref:Transcriptional regulatory protein ZraR n=1 Tax=Polystyrenella longa TaxID=2528007 RepID=A0A518CSC3_9PLAN|nr:sigma 54-interacting transcriptional regulator [Polystyrenella longa]QDU82123.1 Transcriptional regulatory protein ZraR [Polystyrenella longa]
MAAKRLRNWDSLVAKSDSPCFVLDVQRRVVLFNRGCEELFGWTMAELGDRECRYVTEPDPLQPESVTSILAPPEEVWQGESIAVPTFVRHRRSTERPLSKLIRFTPLLDEEGLCQAVWGSIGELTSTNKPDKPRPSHSVHTELAALRISLRQQYELDRFIAKSPVMKSVLEQIQLGVGKSQPICLSGERGVGKQHVASIIHHADNPQSRAFVPLNCNSLTDFQLEEELQQLFAASDDDQLPSGLQPGTLYLEEVEYLPREIQQWLVQQFSSVTSQRRPRLMVGLRQSLAQLREDNVFSTEFFYLLAPLQIHLPPLRERPEDLPLLAQFFLEQCSRLFEIDQQISGFDSSVWEQLKQYHWPGNLNELQTTVRDAYANCLGSEIALDDLPFSFRTGRDAQQLTDPLKEQEPLDIALKRIEKELIEETLADCRQIKTNAAKRLGLTRAKLYRRMENLGIPLDDE